MALRQRRYQPVYILGAITFVAGIFSYCGGVLLYSLKPAEPTQERNQLYCEGVFPMVVDKNSWTAPILQTNCWTQSINTANGKGRIRTEARNSEEFTGFCSNRKQFTGKGVAVWSETKGCPFPLYFKANGEPFVLYIKQE